MLMQAQDTTKKKPTKAAPAQDKAAPAQQHTAPPVQQPSAPPHNVPTPVQTHPAPTPPPVNQAPQHPFPQVHPQPGVTPQTPPARQPGQVYTPPNRNPQPAQGVPPARGQVPVSGRPMPPATRTVTTPRGDVIHRDSSGQVRQVHMSNGTVVYRPANAPRRIEVVRPGGRIVVAGAPGHGYVQRPIVVNNVTMVKRTYIYNGVPHALIYRPRVYNGITLDIYTPARYYRPTFYAYAYNPWARPVAYSWGWGGSPWYGYYGGYFTPYPVYASPSLWLTDYMIAATLDAAYQERMAAHLTPTGIYQDAGQSAPMTSDVKQAIAEEVRRQIDMERAAGRDPNAPGAQDANIFADNVPHVFVVNTTLAVSSNAGDCTIAEGDVLRMIGPLPPNASAADVMVLSSRGHDCSRGSTVSVQLQDLQEMYNQMLATVDRGMGDLQAKQGQGGLPALPQGSAGTTDSPFAQQAQPDANVAGDLTSATQEADRAEQQAVSQTGDAGAPPTLTLGLSIDDVRSIQGEPQKIVDLGSKQIYIYKDLKITFTDGKVSDIQ
jgi:hypothetical protein